MRPYPWKCKTCGECAVSERTIEYVIEKEHDGRAYSLKIPNLEILECEKCHARTLLDVSAERVTEALREAAGLLSPKDIRENRKALGLNQEQFAKLLRVAKETVSRWETGGQIQQRAMDLLLRVFFGVPQVRFWLADPGATLNSTPTITMETIIPGDALTAGERVWNAWTHLREAVAKPQSTPSSNIMLEQPPVPAFIASRMHANPPSK